MTGDHAPVSRDIRTPILREPVIEVCEIQSKDNVTHGQIAYRPHVSNRDDLASRGSESHSPEGNLQIICGRYGVIDGYFSRDFDNVNRRCPRIAHTAAHIREHEAVDIGTRDHQAGGVQGCRNGLA